MYSFSRLNYVCVYVCFLYPLLSGHIDCFHTLAVGTDVAMSWGVQGPEAWSKLFPHAESPPRLTLLTRWLTFY